ncbi:MAG: hypothetical protein SQA66_02155 [Candidatus Fervidibacter sacchari]
MERGCQEQRRHSSKGCYPTTRPSPFPICCRFPTQRFTDPQFAEPYPPLHFPSRFEGNFLTEPCICIYGSNLTQHNWRREVNSRWVGWRRFFWQYW